MSSSRHGRSDRFKLHLSLDRSVVDAACRTAMNCNPDGKPPVSLGSLRRCSAG